LNEQQHAAPTTNNHNSTIAEVTRPRFEMPLFCGRNDEVKQGEEEYEEE
jgi:hypothetical protein